MGSLQLAVRHGDPDVATHFGSSLLTAGIQQKFAKIEEWTYAKGSCNSPHMFVTCTVLLLADTLFGADLTIMEEGTELLHRLEHHLKGDPNKEEPMPMFTSCCPGWVAMVEKSNPELIPYLSTCKSPQMMLGAVIKNYFADEAGVTPDKISAVSVMPCVRKQGEADRPWFNTTGLARDVDHVITTAELGKIFVERGIKLQELEPEEFDNPLSEGSGGAVLFGTTGGVMEAAVRTVYELVTGTPMEKLNFSEVSST